MSGTPGDNRANYRKVFKPNLGPPARFDENQGETNSNDSVERANALALGLTTTNSAPRKAAPAYEPERRDVKPRAAPKSYQREQRETMGSENQVIDSSPVKKGRVGLPPTNRTAGKVRSS